LGQKKKHLQCMDTTQVLRDDNLCWNSSKKMATVPHLELVPAGKNHLLVKQGGQKTCKPRQEKNLKKCVRLGMPTPRL